MTKEARLQEVLQAQARIHTVGLFTDLGVTEVSGGSYARQAITWTADEKLPEYDGSWLR